MTEKWCDHVCPECKTGKHRNCNSLAWCDFHDRETACACLDCEWGRRA